MKQTLITVAVAVLMTGCWGNESTGHGPEETLKVFYTNILSGDFDKAGSLCDSLGMKEYLDNILDKWNEADSSVKAIVPDLLSGTSIKVTDIVKNGQERIVFYELTATDGTSREKTATLSNEEGAWKIKTITGRH